MLILLRKNNIYTNDKFRGLYQDIYLNNENDLVFNSHVLIIIRT